MIGKLSLIPDNLKAICPNVAPFFNGTTCITCLPDKPYFDIEGKSCVSCNKGLVFNPLKHRCDISVIKYLTSPNAPNLLFTR